METIKIMPRNRAKPHTLLRAKMVEKDVGNAYMARRLGMCQSEYSLRMMGRKAWRLCEMYTAMDILGIPADQMPAYFPDYRDLQRIGKKQSGGHVQMKTEPRIQTKEAHQ